MIRWGSAHGAWHLEDERLKDVVAVQALEDRREVQRESSEASSRVRRIQSRFRQEWVSADVLGRAALGDMTWHDDTVWRRIPLLDAHEQQRHRLVDHFREGLANRRQIIGFA